jgi:hypothetical protein
MANIYGADAEEIVSAATKTDIIGAPIDTSKHNYSLTLAANRYPPVNGFWSVTVYDAQTQLLVDNPMNRYVISSSMLSGLKKNADGSVTISLQKDPPAPDIKPNWLPAPNGPFVLIMRLYWPRKVPPPSIMPLDKPTWDPPGLLVAH